MKFSLLLAVLLGCFAATVLGDCYMQHPPGSNNRNREANTNRNNANRLFDSQNNGKGGYCRGPKMTYYAGSLLYVEWTNQHGCGGHPNLWCNVVLQYMCGEDNPAVTSTYIRDGTTTNTITQDAAGVTATDPNGELTYGMHETLEYYEACARRERNMGLFIADRESEGGLTRGRRDARFTRADNNVNRYGFECQEESEYYPYWAPTPWKDIAVFPHDTKFCSFYQQNSENVKGRGQCIDESGNNQVANYDVACTAEGDRWEATPSHGIPPPACIQLPENHDNHLGMNVEGNHNNFYWELPSNEACLDTENGCNCVLRIRYNISTGDVGASGNNPDSGFIDARSNGDNSPVKDDPIISQDGLGHELAIDTTQFGRVFQDRSHVFKIIKRPANLGNSKIFNLNVKGKRGNIVQAYPAVEYDFAPIDTHVLVNDFIHFQWTGCDQNPAGNAGEGTDQTDRSNIVQLQDRSANTPASDEWIKSNPSKVLFRDAETRIRMAYLDQEKSGQCLTYEQLAAKNANNNNAMEQDVQNCMKLNAAEPYFDGGAVRMSNPAGSFYFMSSRNNNFSNRSQKGSITVSNALPLWGIVLVVIGSVVMVSAAGVGAATWYARAHPHSSIGNALHRFG